MHKPREFATTDRLVDQCAPWQWPTMLDHWIGAQFVSTATLTAERGDWFARQWSEFYWNAFNGPPSSQCWRDIVSHADDGSVDLPF